MTAQGTSYNEPYASAGVPNYGVPGEYMQGAYVATPPAPKKRGWIVALVFVILLFIWMMFATFSCTGLVAEDQFLDMLRRAAYFSGRTIQILKVAGAGPDHPFMAHVQESRYLKAVFCRVVD